MIKPNTFRVLIKPIPIKEITTTSGILLPGEQQAGENLLFGEIVDGGDTEFKKGTKVFYSQYSAMAIYDALALIEGTGKLEKNVLVAVAQDDVVAYYDDNKLSKTA